MVPINKVSASSIPQSTVDFAQHLVGADNVASAMSLIDYEPSVEKVMKYVFGQTLICKDIEIAKKVFIFKYISFLFNYIDTSHQCKIFYRSLTIQRFCVDR